VPDESLRKRLFRPVASPGAVLKDGRLVGSWKAKARGGTAEIAVEKIGRVARGAIADEAERVAELRGAADVKLLLA
jgi:Winged helix DNA-binding domain